MNAIEITGLTKRFGRQDAVRNLDLSVPAGSIFALLGPNGAGKTTTIRMLLNQLRLDAGEGQLLGTPIRELSERDFEQIGYVTDNHPLPDWMSLDYLLAYLKPLYPTWDEALCTRLYKLFEIPGTAKIRHLSRGQKMKAALLGALAFRPKLLVMDEPFSGLDPAVRELLIKGMLELSDSEPWTVLISSHDIDEIERLADHIGILRDGQIILTENTNRLLERFRSIDLSLSEERPLHEDCLPPTWWCAESTRKRIRLVDTAYSAEATQQLLSKHFPQTMDASITPMSLREIYLAIHQHSGSK